MYHRLKHQDLFIRHTEILYGPEEKYGTVVKISEDGQENVQSYYKFGLGFLGSERAVWKK